MTKLILALIAARFFSAAQRRILVIGSFYSLLREQGNCHDKMQELNEALGIAGDPKSLLLAAELPSILWKEKKCDELRNLSPERLRNYYHELIPTWLKYDNTNNGFNFEADLDSVLKVIQERNA